MIDKTQLAVSTYDKIAQKYSDTYFNDQSDLKYIEKFFSMLPKNAEVLDVGCGPGTFTQYMIKKGFKVEGIDMSKSMLVIAQKKVPKATFKIMDMRKLTFSENHFNAILCAYSLIHIHTKELDEVISGFHRVLIPGGILMIIAQKGEPDKIIDEPFLPTEKMFFNFFNKNKLTHLLTKSGFKVEYEKEVPCKDQDTVSDAVIYVIGKKVNTN